MLQDKSIGFYVDPWSCYTTSVPLIQNWPFLNPNNFKRPLTWQIRLKKNVVSVDYHVAQYAKIVEDLKVEIQQLKDKIGSLEEENQALRNQVTESFFFNYSTSLPPAS